MSNSEKQQADISCQGYVALGVLMLVLIGMWFLFQILFSATFELTKFATYLVAVLALTVSAYSGMMTRRLKETELQQTRKGAMGTVYADTTELIQIIAEFRDRSNGIQSNQDHEWEEMILDLRVFERRFEQKQSHLSLFATQFSTDTFQKIQVLYLHMLRTLTRVEVFKLNLPQSYGATDRANALNGQRERLLSRLNSCENTVRGHYENVRSSNTDFLALPKTRA